MISIKVKHTHPSISEYGQIYAPHKKNISNVDACDLFYDLAIETWERLKFAYTTTGFKIHETTLTQNILYKLEKARQQFNLDILIREATNEALNGNDIEFVLRNGSKCLRLPMQAKRVYENLSYKAINNNNTQIIDLIDYAEKIGGIPLYLLYNYNGNLLVDNDICSINVDEKQYGCSLIDAYYIKNTFTKKISSNHRLWRTTPEFDDLVPSPSRPWIILPCCLQNFNSLQEVLDEICPNDDYNNEFNQAKIHDCDDVIDDKNWREFDISKGRDGNQLKSEQDSIEGYEPRFQVIIEVD